MKKKVKKLNENERNKISGITLIALVVMIVVLLILAGITINFLFGDNGIIKQAQEAKKEAVIKDEIEKIDSIYYILSSEYDDDITAGDVNEQLKKNDVNAKAVDEIGKIRITFSDSKNSYYLYTDDETSTGITVGTVELIDGENVTNNTNGLSDDIISQIESAISAGKATVVGEKNIVTLDNGKTYQKDEDANYEELDVRVDKTPGVLSGKGTEASPYKIQSVEDLVTFTYNVNMGKDSYEGKVVTLDRNLYFDGLYNSYYDKDAKYQSISNSQVSLCAYAPLTDESKESETLYTLMGETTFIPIGIGSNTFKGTFDGKNHYLAGICFDATKFTFASSISSTTGLGVFGNTSSGITIKNFGLETGTFGGIGKSVIYNIGMIVAYVGGYGETTIANCYNKVSCFSNEYNLGGIIGSADTRKITIANCYNKGELVSGKAVGGIIAYNSSWREIYIEYCKNSGNLKINSHFDENQGIGGIIGYSSSDEFVFIEECYNSGKISNYIENGYVGIASYAGGIAGYLNTVCDITGSNNIGDISMSYSITGETAIGGIVGMIKTRNSSYTPFLGVCKNKGKILMQNGTNVNVGGIIGSAETGVEMSNCYNIGNLEVSNSNSKNSTTGNLGGIVGNYVGWEKIDSSDYELSHQDSKIRNCSNQGTINGVEGKITYTSGLVGTISKMVIIQDCANMGEVKGYYNASGIVGTILDSGEVVINHCYNENDVSTATGPGYAGGILSYLNSDGSKIEIYNCYNLGNISGIAFIGGIVGYVKSNTILMITNCYNVGSIMSSLYAGGMIGLGDGEYTAKNTIIVNCFNLGDVTVSSSGGSAGGIIGQGTTNLTITDCYNMGNITGYYTGGILGCGNTNTITNCYNTGNIEGSIAPVGGIVGLVSSGISISNCHNNGNVSNNNSTYAGEIMGDSSYNTTVGTDCTYLSKDVNANANGALGVDDMTEIMSVKNFQKLLNNKCVEYNKTGIIKIYYWSLYSTGIPSFTSTLPSN